MPVRFGESSRPEVRQVLKYILDNPMHVILGSDEEFDRRTRLHWLSGQGRSVPCLHEDCPFCNLPYRECTYVPVLLWSNVRRSWHEAVLPVLESMTAILAGPRAGRIWIVCRSGKRNSRVVFNSAKTSVLPGDFKGFDVEPSLFRMWSMFGKLRRTGPDPTEEPDRDCRHDDDSAAAS